MRYFTLKQTHRWIDVLADFTLSYNKTFHRTIKRAPQSVNKDNEVEVWIEQYRPPPEKHYDPRGTFKIEKVLQTRKRRGRAQESLVKWLRWPKKYNSWIPSADVGTLKEN